MQQMYSVMPTQVLYIWLLQYLLLPIWHILLAESEVNRKYVKYLVS